MQPVSTTGGGPDARLGPSQWIQKSEFVRLIEQALHRLGYEDVAQALEQRSGIPMQPPAAGALQAAVLAGRWSEAADLLPGLVAGGEEAVRGARFLLARQKYLEALRAGDTTTALRVLRGELSALASGPTPASPASGQAPAPGPQGPGEGSSGPAPGAAGACASGSGAAGPQGQGQGQTYGGVCSTAALHALAGLLLCPPQPQPQQGPEADAEVAAARAALLLELRAALPPACLLPEARLEVLVEQALAAQVSRCPFANVGPGGPPLSLLTDFSAGTEGLPTRCIQVVDYHTDEVWHAAFSHSGAWLASASKDRRAVIWQVRGPGAPGGPLVRVHELAGHDAPVALVAWSHDDSLLLTVADETLRVWDTATGQLRQTFASTHREAVTCAAWLPNSTRFVSASVDKNLVILDGVTGQEVGRLRRAYRVQDMAVACSPPPASHLTSTTSATPLGWGSNSSSGALTTPGGSASRSLSATPGGSTPALTALGALGAGVSGGAAGAGAGLGSGLGLAGAGAGAGLLGVAAVTTAAPAVTGPDSAVLVMAASDRCIHVLRLHDQREAVLGPCSSPITSLALSPGGSLLLANLQTQVVQLWGLGQLTCPWPPASPFPAAMQAAAAAAHGSSGYPHTGGQHPHGLGAPGSGIAFLNSLGLKGVPRGSVAVAGAAAPGAGVGGAAHMVVQGGVAGAGSSGGAGGAAGGDPMDVEQPTTEPLLEYRPTEGPRPPGRFVLRSGFGGAADGFVVAGSEEGAVHVWHRATGTLLLQLSGHSATVNTVAWSPARAPHTLLVSASDDRTLRVWAPESALGQH